MGGIAIGCDSDTKSVKGVSRETHSLASSLPAGFWSKADIITSEEAEEVVKAMPENKSIKVIPIIIRCFLFILTEMFTWFVLSLLIYSRSIEKCFT